MHRRDFITLLGGVATAMPHAARAQPSERVRRVGVLMNLTKEDPESARRDMVFRQKLQELGWTEARNLQIEYRWAGADIELHERYAAELVGRAPDVIVASGLAVRALQQLTRTVPIVFTGTIDPVARGYVSNLARPGGNVTGFINIDYKFSATRLGLLKQMVPRLKRAAVLLDLAIIVGDAQYVEIEAAASSLDVSVSRVDVRDVDAMEHALAALASEPNVGIIVTGSTLTTLRRDLIIALAVRYRLPAVYPNRLYVTAGGLISYGPLFVNQYAQAADYVDRILRGTKPGDLPVQAPTRFETVLNLKAAKAIGLDVPRIVLARADHVIQ
jgi:putative ABC transport system substrate-binding protein